MLRFHVGKQVAGLREDRIFYVTCRASGEFSTRPFVMPKGGLLLNFSALYPPGRRHDDGYVMAELQDRAGHVLPGFAREACTIEDIDDDACPLRWKGKERERGASPGVRSGFGST